MVARNRPIHKGLRQIGSRIGIAFFVLALAQCPSACADKITSMLTARDLAHPTILTPSGEVVSPTSRTAGAAGSAATPTYVAYALTGGEHLPADITTLNATSVAGLTSTGPLDFTPTLEDKPYLGTILVERGPCANFQPGISGFVSAAIRRGELKLDVGYQNVNDRRRKLDPFEHVVGDHDVVEPWATDREQHQWDLRETDQ